MREASSILAIGAGDEKELGSHSIIDPAVIS